MVRHETCQNPSPLRRSTSIHGLKTVGIPFQRVPTSFEIRGLHSIRLRKSFNPMLGSTRAFLRLT